MSTSINKSFVLKTSTGTLWRFFLSPEDNIVYCQLDSQTESETHSLLLDSQLVKDFAATIDSSDNIHVLAHTTANQLVYYRWNGLKWQRQTVEYLRSPTQNIPYFTIMAHRNIIHVLYYIKGSSKSGTELLMHYRWNGNKWIKQKTWTFPANSFTGIENAFVDNLGNVHLLFSQRLGHQPVLLYSCFSPSFSSWTTPVTIYKPGQACSDFYLYADSHHNLYIIWKEKEGTDHVIKYLPAKSGLQPRSNAQEAKAIYTGQEEPILPTLLLLKELYCLWEMKGDIYFTSSQDGGNTWNSPKIISRTSSDSVTFFYYTSFDRPDLPPTLKLWGINYKEVLDLKEFLNFSERTSVQTDTPEKKEDQQLLYTKLEKRITSIEQQVENMASTIYAFQEQLLQNSKSMYFLEAMIKKLNFQVEQLRTNAKQPLYSIDSLHKEKRPVPNKEQASQTSSISQLSRDNTTEHITPPSSSPTIPGSNMLSPNQSKQTTTRPSDAAQPLREPQTSSQGTDNDQTLGAAQSQNTPQRISLGNVDIIINPQEEG